MIDIEVNENNSEAVEVEYYIVVHKTELTYLDHDSYLTEDIEEAIYFTDIEDAEEEISTCDFPNEFEIKKVKITYEILRIK